MRTETPLSTIPPNATGITTENKLAVLSETESDDSEQQVSGVPENNPGQTLKDGQPVTDPGQSTPPPPFNTGAAILIALCAAAVLAGAFIWVKVRKVRR